MNAWNNIKTVIVAITANLLAYFEPLGDEMFILSMVFVVNFFAGLVTDISVNGERFKFIKAWRCIKEVMVFFAMCFFIFTFGEKKGWTDGATQSVSFLTYVITWFYGQNILRNVRDLFRQGSTAYNVVSFLYYILSVEFVKKIPHLQEWVSENTKTRKNCKTYNQKKNEDKRTGNQDHQEV